MRKNSKMILLPLAAGSAVLGYCSGAKPQKSETKPNVIIIYTDDMGYSDCGAFGGQFTPTPNIDRMGSEGIIFNQYYTACSISSPSRVGITTGMYPTEWGITTFLNNRKANRENNSNDFLSAQAPSMARSFKAGGYATAHIGKWHMGGGRDVKDEPQISEFGFDEWCSTWESPSPDPLITATDWIWSEKDSIKRWERTAYFVDKTLDFLKRHSEEPCFVNLWPDDMHTPYVPSKEEYDKSGKRGNWEKQANFIPVLSEYDKQIGRLMDGIEKLGLKDNTIIIFTSDNGPNPSYKNGRTAGLRGQKATLYEGGIRMPFIIRWPEKIKAGQVNNETVLTSLDLFPTLCSMAGVKPVTGGYVLDGIDFSKTMTGGGTQKRNKPMYWEFGQHFVGEPLPENHYQTRSPNIAVRDGDWKLLINYDGSMTELYNLKDDVNETTNVAEKYPSVTSKLSKLALAWYKQSFRKYAGEL